MSILRIKDENGNFIPIYSIRGDDGKSAYEQAKSGGYTGTEEEFIAILNGLTIGEAAGHYSDFNNPHKVTAYQTRAVQLCRQMNHVSVLEIVEEGNYYVTNAQDIPDGANQTGYLQVVAHPTEPDYRVVSWREYNSNVEYVNVLEAGTWLGWGYGYLPITGGTLTGGTLFLNGGSGRITSGQNYMQLDVFDTPKDDNNRRRLVINGKNSANVEDAVMLSTIENGKQLYYTIYGEHNKPTPAEIGAVKIETGSYKGNHEYDPIELTFSSTPKLLIVIPDVKEMPPNTGKLIALNGQSTVSIAEPYNVSSDHYAKITWGKTVSFYSVDGDGDETICMNVGGVVYSYIAIL